MAWQLLQSAGSEQTATGAEPLDVRHSTCDSVQLQLRPAVWTRAADAWQHAAVGGRDYWRLENKRHLAHRRWTAANLRRCGRQSSADLWWTATQHRGDSQAQSWLGLGGPLLCG